MMSGSAVRYFLAFAITVTIFGTALFISSYFNEKRLQNIEGLAGKIATDIRSLEIQYELLQESACSDVEEGTVLSRELNSLAGRLAHTEGTLGSDNAEVERLKRSYFLLEIQDYLLMQRITEKCDGIDPVFVLYFYGDEEHCSECVRAGHVLTRVRQQYPGLRVYSFDYHFDLGALDTLISINDVQSDLPALVIDDSVYYGFQSSEEMAELLPLERLATSSPEI